jgi:uncharacterized damage-inducible protein DinB
VATETRGDLGPPYVFEDEKATLVKFLDYLREAVIAKLSGLGEADARKSLVPSGTSLLGLAKHLTLVELGWFSWSFDGDDSDDLGPKDDELGPDDTVDSVVAGYRSAIAHSNKIVADVEDLDELAERVWGDRDPPTLRWILVHMVEETARHAGHADILREQIDGSVGR